jgi:hypothetical protein
MSEDDAERPREFRHSSRSGGIPRSGRVGLLISHLSLIFKKDQEIKPTKSSQDEDSGD